MEEEDVLKKKRKRKRSSKVGGQKQRRNTFPTLASIVLSNGSQVVIPKLPSCTSGLTIYDHLRIAMEHAALATCCLNRLGSGFTPRLADSHNLAPIRLNLEDLMNHLYYAIEGFQKGTGSA
jgi:hypothetical protein